ncbi:MAG: DUF4442 domain-containing protein [Myxococcales bacterium]
MAAPDGPRPQLHFEAGRRSRGVSIDWQRTLELWAFGALKVPLIFFVRPEVLRLDHDEVLLRVRLRRGTANHYGTMFFGALAIGADVVPGVLAVATGRAQKCRVSILIKSANFTLRRGVSSHVLLKCTQGPLMAELVARSLESGRPTTGELEIDAILETTSEAVASFRMGVSVKAV